MGTIASYYEARTTDAGAGDTVEITQNPEKMHCPSQKEGCQKDREPKPKASRKPLGVPALSHKSLRATCIAVTLAKSLLATKLVADMRHLGGSALCQLTAMNYSAKHNYGNNYCRNMLGCITRRHPYHCRQLEYRTLECRNATIAN